MSVWAYLKTGLLKEGFLESGSDKYLLERTIFKFMGFVILSSHL